nr:hypothetical protein [Tanacetum cinerariifolium]
RGYQNTIELPGGNNVVPLRSDTIRDTEHVGDDKLYEKNTDESWDIIVNLALYDHEGSDDPRDFAKPNEKNTKNDEVVDTNVIGLSELNAIEPNIMKELVDEINAEQVRNVRGPEEELRYNDSLLATRLGKMDHENYNSLPIGPMYNTVIKKKKTKKEVIGGNFVIPCNIGGLKQTDALVNKGSNINDMPISTYNRLTSKKPLVTDIRLSLASHSYIYPIGIVKDVLTKVASYVYPMDFVILDIKEDKKKPFILGTPFLTTAKAEIRFDKGIITLKSGKSKINFFKILVSPWRFKEETKTDIDPVPLANIVSRLILEWEVRIKLHQKREVKFNQWRGKVFNDEWSAPVNKGYEEVIEFGDSYEAPQEDPGTGSASESSAKKKGRTVAVTTEDMQKRRNDVKARTTLLFALPDEHQLRFNKYKTAPELWGAILKTFGGNEATKKTKKTQLKQQFGNFKVEGSETLEQTFNRLQAIVSHLEFLDVEIKQDDLNQKFLTSLAPEWLMWSASISSRWVILLGSAGHPGAKTGVEKKSTNKRNRANLDTMSLDDLYNRLKVYEPEVQKKSESNSQNMAFISSAKNSSGKGEVNTASIPTANTQVSPASANVVAIDKDDIEEMDIK